MIRSSATTAPDAACDKCGCTEQNACVILDRQGTFCGCRWDVLAPGTMCSACSGADRRVQGPNQ